VRLHKARFVQLHKGPDQRALNASFKALGVTGVIVEVFSGVRVKECRMQTRSPFSDESKQCQQWG
jgi:hypothetical protein